MSLRLGNGTAIGWAEESAWGTPVSRTTWARAVSVDLRQKTDRKPRPVLASASSGVANRMFTGGITVQGTIVMLMAFEGLGLILKHALYKTPTTTGSGSPYTHTYKLQGATPTGGLTLEIVLGDSGQSEVFSGIRINKMSIECKPGDVARVTLDVIGKTSAGRSSTGTPSYTTNDGTVDVTHDMIGAMAWNSNNYPLTSFKLTVDNKLAQRPVLGSFYTQDPKLSSMREVTLEGEWETTDDTLYTGLLAGTAGDAVVNITGTNPYAGSITVTGAELTTADDPISQMGVIKQTFKMMGLGDSSATGLTMTITNTQSSGVAP